MSKGKRNRRPGGHPAKVAVRRERDAAGRSGGPAGPEGVARRIVHEAHELTSALDAEWSAGVTAAWRVLEPAIYAAAGPGGVARLQPDSWRATDRGGRSARRRRGAERAERHRDRGRRRAWHPRRRGSAQKLEPDEAEPSWLGDVGETEITGAAVMHEDVFDDASTVFLEARHPNHETHAIGVLIDNNLGHMAKDILLADSIDRVAEVMRKHPQGDGDSRRSK